ncbi:DnaJ sub A member 3, mitochondrial [Tieghemiomyces parasiticus]|uniref:DnaJ sub A member 3, mitochondrial n=1 Tax=Tieghemiomyces parasiticus TaxID=78921 RepID=A0A9W8AIU9_9FUNG|nr:DnaJ sub A member 3, mitochondrial [Tieghemiomyces parasiticus]
MLRVRSFPTASLGGIIQPPLRLPRCSGYALRTTILTSRPSGRPDILTRTYASAARRSGDTFYESLGVSPQSTRPDIKKAFYKLSMKYHPDRNAGNSEAHSKFIQLSEAYDTLSDEVKRREYDRQLRVNQQTYHGPGTSGYGYTSPSRTRYHHPGTARRRPASWMHQNPEENSGDKAGEADPAYRHHWSDGHLHSASRFYTHAQAWDRTQARATAARPQPSDGGAHFSPDLEHTSTEIHLMRASGLGASVLVWAGLIFGLVYGGNFYVKNMRTEASSTSERPVE